MLCICCCLSISRAWSIAILWFDFFVFLGLAFPLRAFETSYASSSSSKACLPILSTSNPVFRSVTSWSKLRPNALTSVNGIALYMNIWNSLIFPLAAARLRVAKIWFKLDVLPVPGCPQRYIRPDLRLRILAVRNFVISRCSFSLVNTCYYARVRRILVRSCWEIPF